MAQSQRLSAGCLPRRFGEVDDPEARLETVLHVPDARVAWADYGALQHDFPRLDGLTQADIDAWLVAHAAFVSEAQACQAVVNTSICTDGTRKPALRPPRYGRAVIVEAPGGLLDLKGAGVRPGWTPSNAAHSSGLEHMAVAFGDLLLKFVIDEIFSHVAPHHFSVPVYAILDLGFDLCDDWQINAAAGLQVRRAHRRPRGGDALPSSGSQEQLTQFEIEMAIRNYGLTSTTWANSLILCDTDGVVDAAIGDAPLMGLSGEDIAHFRRLLGQASAERIERINVQLSRDEPGDSPGHLLDFGHFNVRARFDYPVASAVADRPYCLGPILRPRDSAYIQPDPDIALGPEFWNRPNLNPFCSDLTRGVRAEPDARQRLSKALFAPLERVLAQWDRWDEVS